MAPSIFSKLPDDILTQICILIQEAHPATLLALLFLKDTKSAAETVLYRSITLRGPPIHDNVQHWPVGKSKQLASHLLDDRSGLCSLIREICICRCTPVSDISLLVDLLKKMPSLSVFSWESANAIPSRVLDTLNQCSPTAQLKLKIRRQTNSVYPQSWALDFPALRSPQLHTLDLVALQSYAAPGGENSHTSELPVLQRVLRNAPDLRVLKLACFEPNIVIRNNVIHDWQQQFGVEGNGPLNLQFEQRDSFPALSEFVILQQEGVKWHPGYHMDLNHCIAFKRAMDWRRLRKLDLGNARSFDFFKVFHGCLPKLQSLKFRIYDHLHEDSSHEKILRATEKFLGSIHSLEELVIRDWTRYFIIDLRSVISQHKHLERIEINPTISSSHNAVAWSETNLMGLLQTLPELRHLILVIDLSQSQLFWMTRRPKTWPEKPFAILTHLPNITSLNLRIKFPHGGNAPPPLDHDAISKLAADLFRGFFEHDPNSRLISLVLQIEREETYLMDGAGNVGVTARIARAVRDDAPTPLMGGYSCVTTNECEGFWAANV